MSFFASKRSAERVVTPITHQNASLEPAAGRFYRELVDQRPALIDEKLKLHARIIDEFNLALLEKLPHEEFVRQISAYVTNYVRAENLSLNQKELNIFSEEIIAEMIGYGPIEPLLKDRSEEHTSELQSHLNLVCRLLLEKKKTSKSSNAP